MKQFDERMLYNAAQAIGRMPPALQRAVGGGPIVRDGQELEPELAVLLRLSAVTTSSHWTSLEDFRREQMKNARIAGGYPLPVHAVRDLEIDGAAGRLRARHYLPDPKSDGTNGAPPPLLVFFHGGGFLFGDLDSHDAPCRYLCRHAGAHVLAVEYRLAPEHPFPAAPLDARAALGWAFANAARLGADPSRIGVAGDSAGANLSAVASLLARDDGGPMPVCQILIYPPVDRRKAWPSVELFGEGFFLTRELIDWFRAQYAGRQAALDPRLDPLAATDLSRLPPALVVTAGFDPLRDEGEAYAHALAAAGTRVTLRRFSGLFHGFFNMVGVSRAARDAVIEIAGGARVLLSAPER